VRKRVGALGVPQGRLTSLHWVAMGEEVERIDIAWMVPRRGLVSTKEGSLGLYTKVMLVPASRIGRWSSVARSVEVTVDQPSVSCVRQQGWPGQEG
jgi:hypothetical protein